MYMNSKGLHGSPKSDSEKLGNENQIKQPLAYCGNESNIIEIEKKSDCHTSHLKIKAAASSDR